MATSSSHGPEGRRDRDALTWLLWSYEEFDAPEEVDAVFRAQRRLSVGHGPLCGCRGLAAALSTADGLLMVMVTGITRDIYHRFINPNVPEEAEVRMTRVLVMVLSVAASFLAFLAIQDPRFALYVALLVGWAFVFAAASFTPAVVLGTFWKRLNRHGIVWAWWQGWPPPFPTSSPWACLGFPLGPCSASLSAPSLGGAWPSW